MIVNVFSETADAVAAHFHLPTVSIVDLHLKVGDLRRMDREELVGPDAEAAIAEPLGNTSEVANLPVEAVKKDKIIAATMHLGKLQLTHCVLNP